MYDTICMDRFPPQHVKLLRYPVCHYGTFENNHVIDIAEVDVALNTLVLGQILQFSASAQFAPPSLYIFAHCMLGCSTGVVGVLGPFLIQNGGHLQGSFSVAEVCNQRACDYSLESFCIHTIFLIFLKLSKNNVGVVDCNVNQVMDNSEVVFIL